MTKSIALFSITIILAGGCGPTRTPKQAEAAELVARLMRADRTIVAFRSKVRVTTFDSAGNKVAPDKSGYRLYAKPDMSLVCIAAADGNPESASEIRTVLRTRKSGVAATSTLPDSYFLRDIGSMLSVPLEAGPSGDSAPKPEFVLDPGQATTGHSSGVHTLSMVYPGYERAVLKVNADSGLILEKTVYGADNSVKSRELYSEFVPLNGGYLPSRTSYEWAGGKAVVHLWDYHAEEQPPLSFFENAGAACGTLAARFGRMPPLESDSLEPRNEAGL